MKGGHRNSHLPWSQWSIIPNKSTRYGISQIEKAMNYALDPIQPKCFLVSKYVFCCFRSFAAPKPTSREQKAHEEFYKTFLKATQYAGA